MEAEDLKRRTGICEEHLKKNGEQINTGDLINDCSTECPIYSTCPLTIEHYEDKESSGDP